MGLRAPACQGGVAGVEAGFVRERQRGHGTLAAVHRRLDLTLQLQAVG